MGKLAKYWRYFKSGARILVIWFILFTVIVLSLLAVLDFLGAGPVLKSVFSLIVVGASLWRLIEEFKEEWPPTDQEQQTPTFWWRYHSPGVSEDSQSFDTSSSGSEEGPMDGLPGPGDGDYEEGHGIGDGQTMYDWIFDDDE